MPKQCSGCAYLRMPSKPEHAEHYRVCGWWDAAFPTTPPAGYIQMEILRLAREPHTWVTVAEVDGKAPALDCPVWQPKVIA